VKGFHASGHLSQNDLVKVIDEINPDKIIPIHTRTNSSSKNTDNAAEAENGQVLAL
jgi:ribonuclease J